MQGAIRRLGVAVAVAGALAGATAGQAQAMASPACSTRLAAADAGTTAFCGFDTQWDYATITVEPAAGTVTATTRCVTPWYTYTSSRTTSKTIYWHTYTPGYCTLTLTSGAPLTTANASATPWIPPIYDPPPPPYLTE